MGYIKIMLCAMLPVIELRGAIPLGISLKLNPIGAYIFSVIGSTIVAIPIILMFRYVLEYLKSKKYFEKLTNNIEDKILRRSKKLKTLNIIGIILFVGIPLPTTGTWSAAAIAAIFKMRIKDALLGIFLGNAVAGIIVSSVSLHLI